MKCANNECNFSFSYCIFFKLSGSADKVSETPYGLHPAYAAYKPVAKENLPESSTPISDRIANLEAMLLAFLAENSLPFSVAPDLLELVKEMSKDKKALNQITMHRNSASYKTRFGIAKTMKEALFKDLQTEFFSLNLDESTNNSNQKVVSVLVNYMSNGSISTKHLSSYCVDSVNSEAIFQCLVQIFEKNNIPWQNLMSVLLDSCNVMRGKNAGLEVKIRSKCPHLLDIDGDSCHHVHNSTKQFCKPFGMHVESLITDIYNDLKWSPDLRAIFCEICSALKIKYTIPQAFISFRWLSVYDAAQDLLRLLGALTVFYFPFLSAFDKTQFLHIVVSVYKDLNVGDAAKDHIRNVQQSLTDKVKTLTQAGKERKGRILKKLFDQRLETQLISNLFVSVLSQLKEYVMLFQSNSPLIHILHDKQLSLLRDFLACFIKAENIAANSAKKIKRLDVKDEKNHLPMKSIFMGNAVVNLSNSVPKSKLDVVKKFQKNVLEAYILCSQALQKKMPLENLLLQSVSAIDPICRKHSLSLKLMKGLPDLVTNVINSEERDAYDKEVHKYHVANLKKPQQKEPVDKWWTEVRNSGQFPLVSKMACAVLTSFHGPKVESSFSMMNSVVTSGKNRLTVESFDAIQTVKYELMSQEKSAVEMYKKKNYLQENVDKNLCKNMHSASKAYKEVCSQKKCDKQLIVSVSKEAAKKITAKAAKLQRNVHIKKMKSQIPKNPSTKICTQNETQKLAIKRKLDQVNDETPVKNPPKATSVSKKKCKGPLTIMDMFGKKS